MAAKNTFGTTLKLGTSGGALTAVANLTNITASGFSRDTIDVTTHDTAGGAAEYIADGVYDAGEITCEGNLIAGSTDDDRLIAAMVGGTLQDWEIDFKADTGTKTWVGSAIITAYTPGDLPVKGGKQSFSLTMKVTGAITVDA